MVHSKTKTKTMCEWMKTKCNRRRCRYGGNNFIEDERHVNYESQSAIETTQSMHTNSHRHTYKNEREREKRKKHSYKKHIHS